MCCQSPEPPAREESESKGAHKRNLSNGESELSPARRSKRQKPAVSLKEQSDSEAEHSETERIAAPTKEDKEHKSGSKTPQKKAPIKKEAKEDPKPKKARKTKKDQESEAVPLAPRTKGLRMFVGAHVSAAKGQFRILLRVESINNSIMTRCLQLYPQQ